MKNLPIIKWLVTMAIKEAVRSLCKLLTPLSGVFHMYIYLKVVMVYYSKRESSITADIQGCNKIAGNLEGRM